MEIKRMTTLLRVSVDIILVTLFLPTMAYHITDYKIHEWFGVLLFIFLFLHLYFNRNWYRSLFKGKYTVVRIIYAVINILLMITMLTILVTGIMDSYIVFDFLDIHAGRLAGKLHLLAAIWGFLLISVHLGFHWGSVAGIVHSVCASRLAIVLLSGYGVYAFITHKLGQKLFLLARHSTLDFVEPAAFFFADYITIMCLFACIGYYGVKLIQIKQFKNSR